MKKFFFLIILTAILSCSKSESPKIKSITVSILPQKYFVQRITEDNFNINVMIPPGASPASYEPTPKQMKDIENSSIYFRIGYIPFETAWMKKLHNINPKMKVINTADGVELIKGHHSHHKDRETHSDEDYHINKEHHKGEDSHEIDNEHNDEEHHKSNANHTDEIHHEKDDSETGIDPHIWLSPNAVKVQIKNIYESLAEFDPENKDFYKSNYENFKAEIDSVYSEMKNVLKDYESKKFLVYHPAWTYFARDFNLTQISLEEEGKAPSPLTVKKLVETAEKENIKAIFVQKQFDKKNAETAAKEFGGEVIQIDPLDENWLKNMISITKTFRAVLEKE